MSEAASPTPSPGDDSSGAEESSSLAPAAGAPPVPTAGEGGSQIARGARLLLGLAVLGLAVKGMISLVPKEDLVPFVTPQVPPRVQVLELQAEQFVQTEERYARLQPCQEWTLRLEVGGRLAQRPVMNGQECEPGRLLLALDPIPFKAEVSAAEARLRNTESGLRLSEAELERVKALSASTATQRDLDAALAERDQSLALKAEANAALRQALFRLEHSSLFAPTKGVVSQLSVEAGAVVVPSQTLGRFARRDVLIAKILVSAEVRRGLVVGQEATLVDDVERVYPAVLARGAPVPSGTSGQFEVEFEVKNSDRRLLPGEPVRVRFSHGKALARLRVPRGTVYEEYGLWRALVPPAERGSGAFRAGSAPVVLGPGDALAGWVTIHSGLRVGSKVLVPDRVVRVREGQNVAVGQIDSTWLPPYAGR
ncbi:MAG: efflux RND transporter periplasmic adaptor subunit [Planctomycetes bacterium]|nr:efflux RND transporter periplasmic adaptor subunit [Planctomycetota bacterium]